MQNLKGGNPNMQHKAFTVVKSLLTFSFLILLLQACTKQDLETADRSGIDQLKANNGYVSNSTVMAWNEVAQKMYTTPIGVGSPPPILSRSFTMIQVAMHDALNGIKPKFETYAYKGAVDKDADPDAAVTQAAYRMIVALQYPWQAGTMGMATALHTNSLNAIPNGDAKTKGIALGNAVADAMLAKRSADAPFLQIAGHPLTPPNGTVPGEYRYLPPLGYALAVFDKQQTWVMNSSSQFRPAAIYGNTNVTQAVATAQYAADYEEVRQYGRIGNSSRTPDQSEIGVFWAENSSRGWNAVAREVINSRPANSMDAWKTARLLALTHIAVADAYIAVFDAKIYFNFWRPISAIQLADTDGNPNTTGEPSWQPVLVTPAVGEYPSAHAMSGAAAGGVLIRFFDKDQFPIVATSGYIPGVTRNYNTISSAVRDNSLSRIYIGYHFRHAIDVGEEIGYDIGDFVFENALKEK